MYGLRHRHKVKIPVITHLRLKCVPYEYTLHGNLFRIKLDYSRLYVGDVRKHEQNVCTLMKN